MGRTVEGMTKKTTSGDKIILQPPPPAKKQKMKTGVAIATMTVCYNWYLSLSTYVCNIHFFLQKSEEEEYPDDYVEATPYGTVTKCFLLKELPNGLCKSYTYYIYTRVFSLHIYKYFRYWREIVGQNVDVYT